MRAHRETAITTATASGGRIVSGQSATGSSVGAEIRDAHLSSAGTEISVEEMKRIK